MPSHGVTAYANHALDRSGGPHLGEREGAAPGFVSRYLPGALAFTLSAALAPTSLSAASDARPGAASGRQGRARPVGGLGPVVPAPSLAMPVKPAGNPFGRLVVEGFGSSDQFAMVESRFRCRRSRLSICARRRRKTLRRCLRAGRRCCRVRNRRRSRRPSPAPRRAHAPGADPEAAKPGPGVRETIRQFRLPRRKLRTARSPMRRRRRRARAPAPLWRRATGSARRAAAASGASCAV